MRVTKIFLLIAAVLIAAEQAFLHTYLDQVVEFRNSDFQTFIDEVEESPGGVAGILYERCEYHPIAVIYNYRMCIRRGSIDPVTGAAKFVFGIQKSGGYLSLIRRDDDDRILWDGKFLFVLNERGEIISDARGDE